jgi:hypothetical protein
MKHLNILFALFFAINLTAQNDTIIHTMTINENEKVVFWGFGDGVYSNPLSTTKIFLHKKNKRKQLIWDAPTYFRIVYPNKNFTSLSKKRSLYCNINPNDFLLKDDKCSFILHDYIDKYLVSLKYNNRKWNAIFYQELNYQIDSGLPHFSQLIAMNTWQFGKWISLDYIYHINSKTQQLEIFRPYGVLNLTKLDAQIDKLIGICTLKLGKQVKYLLQSRSRHYLSIYKLEETRLLPNLNKK